MKTKFGKLNLSVENLKKSWSNLVWITLVASTIVIGLYIAFDIEPPEAIQIDVSKFGGKIITRNEISGLQNSLLINSSFDEAISWGNDAILVYNSPSDGYSPDIQIYRTYQQICGAFQYASYSPTWKITWKTYCIVYDTNRKKIICYPDKTVFFWGWITILFVVLGVILFRLCQDLVEQIKD